MRHIGQSAKLFLEAIYMGGLGARKSLQRDRLVHFTIVRFVNHTHATRAQTTTQDVTLCANKFFGCLSHCGETLS